MESSYLQSLGVEPGKYIIAVGRITPEKGFVLKRYVAMGGKLVTFASDAHVSENLGRRKEDFVEFAKACGIKEGCYFKGKQVFTYGL